MHADPATNQPDEPRKVSDSHHAGIGDVVDGRYHIEFVLGRGSWSVVYAATSVRTGQPVALKMLLRGLPCGDAQAEQRFFREAQVTAALQHPNTLRVFDVGRTSGGALYIASERLSGPTLEEELSAQAARGRPMSEAEVLEIADAVLRSLAEAHDKGLVHRDLKPANVVLHEVAGERVVKVVDFGIASLKGQRITERGVSLGTPDYMSPEQCARQDLDGRSDLYALGVILYRALTCRVPFVGDDVFAVMEQHRESDPPDVREAMPDVSEGVALLIDRALQKHPDHRFQDARKMQEAVARAARDLPNSPRLRPRSQSRIPRVVIAQGPTQDTGSWRVSAKDRVTAATQVATGSRARVRSTVKYAQVTTEALEAHRSKGPKLEVRPDDAAVAEASAPAPSSAATAAATAAATGAAKPDVAPEAASRAAGEDQKLTVVTEAVPQRTRSAPPAGAQDRGSARLRGPSKTDVPSVAHPDLPPSARAPAPPPPSPLASLWPWGLVACALGLVIWLAVR